MKRKSPKDATKRIAKGIPRDRRTPGRGKHNNTIHVPVLVNLGSGAYLFSPQAHRKDAVVVPLKAGPDGLPARDGKGKNYARLAAALDEHADTLKLTMAQMNSCLRFLLKQSEASLMNLPFKVDEACYNDLLELTAVFRIDNARSSRARELIKSHGLSDEHTFTQRFAKPVLYYFGADAGKGSQKLQTYTREAKEKEKKEKEKKAPANKKRKSGYTADDDES